MQKILALLCFLLQNMLKLQDLMIGKYTIGKNFYHEHTHLMEKTTNNDELRKKKTRTQQTLK